MWSVHAPWHYSKKKNVPPIPRSVVFPTKNGSQNSSQHCVGQWDLPEPSSISLWFTSGLWFKNHSSKSSKQIPLKDYLYFQSRSISSLDFRKFKHTTSYHLHIRMFISLYMYCFDMGPSLTCLEGRQARKITATKWKKWQQRGAWDNNAPGPGPECFRVVWQTLEDRDNDVMTCRYLKLQTTYLSGAYLHLVDMSNLVIDKWYACTMFIQTWQCTPCLRVI